MCGSVCFPLQGDIFFPFTPFFIPFPSHRSRFLSHYPFFSLPDLSLRLPPSYCLLRSFCGCWKLYHYSLAPKAIATKCPPTSPGIWSESDLPALASSFFPQCPVTDFTILLFDDMRATAATAPNCTPLSGWLLYCPNPPSCAPPFPPSFLDLSFIFFGPFTCHASRNQLQTTFPLRHSPPFSRHLAFSSSPPYLWPLVARIPLFLVAFPPPSSQYDSRAAKR